MVLLVVHWHALAFYHFDSLGSDHLVDCQQHTSPVQQRNLNWLALYGILEGDLVPVYQVILLAHVPGGYGVGVVEARRSCLEVYEQVRSLSPWLLVTLVSVSVVVVEVHSWLHFNLLVGNCLNQGLAVKSYRLFLVTDCLDASIVELFQSDRQLNLNSWHWGHFWLVYSAKS